LISVRKNGRTAWEEFEMIVGGNSGVGIGVGVSVGNVGKDRGVSFTSTLPSFKRQQLASQNLGKPSVNFDNKWSVHY
jgi:hypothetical protein